MADETKSGLDKAVAELAQLANVEAAEGLALVEGEGLGVLPSGTCSGCGAEGPVALIAVRVRGAAAKGRVLTLVCQPCARDEDKLNEATDTELSRVQGFLVAAMAAAEVDPATVTANMPPAAGRS